MLSMPYSVSCSGSSTPVFTVAKVSKLYNESQTLLPTVSLSFLPFSSEVVLSRRMLAKVGSNYIWSVYPTTCRARSSLEPIFKAGRVIDYWQRLQWESRTW